MIKSLLATTALVITMVLSGFADNSGRIYGKVTTVDGDVFTGLIRWDKNEANWVDILDGNKDIPKRTHSDKRERRQYGERETSIEIFGISLGKSSWNYSSVGQSGIRFGHIRVLEVIDDDRALLILKSGQEIELGNGSTDIGEDIREIIIEDEDEGEIEFLWDDIATIEFMPADPGLTSNFGERLYGTVSTRRGEEYSGFICWDVDEIFPTDILDGESERRDRKVKFEKISSIKRYSSNGATVVLTNGDELVLKGTNDVDDGNRGIIVSDPGFGQVIIKWDEFERLDFSTPRRQVTYDDFDGGRSLKGVVYTEDGDQFRGLVRWDNDEEYTWEILDGEYHDVEFDIEFSLISKIEKRSHRSSLVTVKDGRSFRLRGSNDVDDDNRGIYIQTTDGEEIEVEWDEFAYVEFE